MLGSACDPPILRCTWFYGYLSNEISGNLVHSQLPVYCSLEMYLKKANKSVRVRMRSTHTSLYLVLRIFKW